IDAVTGRGLGPVGFAEIAVAGVSLTEQVQVPDDIGRDAARSPALAAAMRGAATTYRFERLHDDQGHDEELVLHRIFGTVATRTYELTGTLRLSPTTPDAVLDGLVGGPEGASATSR